MHLISDILRLFLVSICRGDFKFHQSNILTQYLYCKNEMHINER